MKTTKQTLEAARALIADKAHWTQREPARNDKGEPVSPHNPDAVAFCSVGALIKVTGRAMNAPITREFYPEYYAGLTALTLSIHKHSVTGFNDSHKHEEVLQLFDKAIANAND